MARIIRRVTAPVVVSRQQHQQLRMMLCWGLLLLATTTTTLLPFAHAISPSAAGSILVPPHARRQPRHSTTITPALFCRGGGSSATTEGLKASLASALAAACSKTILAPFDTLKTVQQYYKTTGKSLSFLEASRMIMKRPKGFMEFYVSMMMILIVLL